ncbi:E3 ubiquitin ligase BIG BROTHER-related-like [Argentina anserina]|uniref:E3 ubiquitin ligase BIG BROTHER-related-like n=1 Tax=Argentina anserina TaxID=57926 RepID=UPI0021764CDF|nr:E3 ubiquitin ligase BIG BROTHER-related-like [Potentilla anserina]
MENDNAKLVPNGGLKPNPSNNREDNPTLNRCGDEEEEEQVTTQLPEPPSPNAPQSSRTPFTNLSQVDADLALARTLQEQERAYMMLRMNNEESDYGSWEAGSYVHGDEDDFHDDTDENDDDGTDADDEEEDAFDVHAHDDGGDDNYPSVVYDPTVFSSDEAYARALQDAEERDMAARLLALAGIDDREAEDTEDEGGNSQDAWEEVDPDELSYEELLALGEVVGSESRGLPPDTIASLPSVSYKMGSGQNGINESCVICRIDYDDGENLTVLSCKHTYHSECIHNWLKINKVCFGRLLYPLSLYSCQFSNK